MQFTSIMTTGLLAALASAAPSWPKTTFQVSGFQGASYSETARTHYEFSVTSHTNDSARDFGTATCRVELHASEFVPVNEALCQAENGNVVSFGLERYAEDGAFAGWNLKVWHMYHDSQLGLIFDTGVYQVPKSYVVNAGQGEGAHRSILIDQGVIMPVTKN